jgi:DNA-binding response OmpR family regulator
MPDILIIEDDAALLTAYTTVLRAEQFTTHVAIDGVEGLAIARRIKPDIILLDMLMPNLNGLEFLREFDVKRKYPNTKVIMFSNMSVPSDVHDALELGASKYLTKSSFTPKEIAGIINEVISSGE